jgi:acetyltransferase-like isoleucine patch superfamily enzyme
MIIRQLRVKCWRFFKFYSLRREHIYIDRGVAFNNNSVISPYCRINSGASINDSEIGSYSYVGKDSKLDACKIGKYCSIASGVLLLTATHPTRDFVSTSPVFHSVAKQCGTTFVSEDRFKQHLTIDKYSLRIGNDVWIGAKALIIGGHSIGDGAVVAAGSVVTKDVPPYAIVGGNPARIIRYRFSAEDIEFLLSDKWWEKTVSWIKDNSRAFSSITHYKELVNSIV